MNKLLTVFMALSAIAAGSASAMTFDEVVNAIAVKSANVVTTTATAEATSIRNSMAGNLADPEIEAEYLFGDGADNKWNIGVGQSFDWPGVYAARRAAAAASTNAARNSVAAAYTEAQSAARLALIDYVNACRNIELLDRIDATMATIQDAVEQDAGSEMTRLDINKIKVERGLLKVKISAWEKRKGEAVASLMTLSPESDVEGMLREMPHNYPASRLLPVDSYLVAVDNDSRIMAANDNADAATKEIDVASMERYPGFSLAYKHAFEEGHHFNGLGVGLSIPVFSSRHKVAAAKATAFEARCEAMTLRATIAAEINTLHARAARLHKSLDQLADIFETTNNIALLKRAHDGGEMSLLQFLTEANYFLESEMEYLDLSYQYNIAVASLARYTPVSPAE